MTGGSTGTGELLPSSLDAAILTPEAPRLIIARVTPSSSGPRDSALFFRNFRVTYPQASRGEGAWITDSAGKRYLDFSGGAAVNFIGHGRTTVAAAMARQAGEVAFVHSSQFMSAPAMELAGALLKLAGPAFEGGRVFFTCGGSEAVETALKLARQYQVERGHRSRFRVLSRQQSYHGATLGAMAVSGNPRRRAIYAPMLPDVTSAPEISTPYCYRCKYENYDCAERYAAEVQAAIKHAGDEAAAFIAEPVSGATLGAAMPPRGYLEKVRELCTASEILLIADEVMTGCGRTGRNFACEHWGIAPDVLVTAKALTSGYLPLGAVIVQKHVADAIAGGTGSFVHGFTYNAHPVAAAAGLEVLEIMRREQLVNAASAEGAAGSAVARALPRLNELDVVGDVRGIGLLWGVEFVADKRTKRPFAPELGFSAAVARACLGRGVLVYPMQGCVDGTAGDHLLIAPPAIIKPEEVSNAVDQIGAAIAEAAQAVQA